MSDAPTASMRLAAASRHPLAIVVAALVATFSLYGRSLPFGFTFDDAEMVSSNPLLAEFDVVRIFRSPILPPQESVPNDLYRPVGVVSLALDHALGGGATWAYRLSNLLLHCTTSLLVLAVARMWGASRSVALLAAAIFLVHPIHSEAVLQIKGRFELLAAVLGLGAVVAGESLPEAVMRVTVALALWVGAMLSKESALGLALLVPVLVATSEWRPRARVAESASGLVAAVLGSLVVSALAIGAVLALRLQALGALARPGSVNLLDNPLAHASIADRLWSSFELVWRYVLLLVFPVRLSADYSFASIEVHSFPGGTGCWLGLGIVLAFVFWFVRAWRARNRLVVASLALLAGPYLIISNMVLPIGTIFGERLVYLPSAGVCIIASAALVGLARRSATPAGESGSVVALTALVVVLFAARTASRVPDWSNNLRLFETALEVNPGSAKMLAWVGRAHLERNELESARELLTRATEIVPHWIDPRVHLARALIFLDRIDLAERELDVASADAPPGEPWIPYHRGLIALRRERFAEAARDFAAADRPPWAASARFNLGFAQLRSGAPLDAAHTYLEAIRRFPSDRRVDRELPRLRDALAEVMSSADLAAACPGAPDWARAWLVKLEEPGLLSERIEHGAPAPRAPCAGTPAAP